MRNQSALSFAEPISHAIDNPERSWDAFRIRFEEWFTGSVSRSSAQD